jgi:pilus assembly protein CpaB
MNQSLERNMKRRILLISLAVVLALVGTVAVYAYVKNADKRATAGEQATKVVVAAKRIPAGTSWATASTGGYLHTEDMPSDVVPADALQSTTADIAAQDVVAADVPAGQIVCSRCSAPRRRPPAACTSPLPRWRFR